MPHQQGNADTGLKARKKSVDWPGQPAVTRQDDQEEQAVPRGWIERIVNLLGFVVTSADFVHNRVTPKPLSYSAVIICRALHYELYNWR